MNIREFLLEKPQENNLISFLQDGVSQNTNEYLANLKRMQSMIFIKINMLKNMKNIISKMKN
ncbi:hypothetical protein B11447_10490 [Campylobacter jejuni]|nr:hypothetical protein [Campylobacter jejuni]BEK33607.1 hypothetical protein B11447_10490 [Campylobacter jejuni]